MISRVYCPTCREHQLDTGSSKCAWCDGVLTSVEPVKRKRRKHSKFTDAMVEQAYAYYLKGHSCNQIAAVIWEKLGFASASTCSSSLRREFHAAGLPLRSQSEVTKRRNFKHGCATREARANGTEAEYRRWFKEQNGRYNPKCRDCKRPAMDGAEFCWSHNPETAERRQEILEGMWAASPVGGKGENHLLAKLTEAEVADIKARPDETLQALADEYGVCKSTIGYIRSGKNWSHVQPARTA